MLEQKVFNITLKSFEW